MKITVHRGSNQIRECVTEYESNEWKLFVDYGEGCRAHLFLTNHWKQMD